MNTARNVEIAKWLCSSGIDLGSAALITGIPQKQLAGLRDTLDRNAWRAFGPPALSIALSALATERKLVFVQVGANDGRTGDPIFQYVMAYGEYALLIEPQPWLAEAIKENYSRFQGELFVESIAVGEEGEHLEVFFLKHEYWDRYIERVGRHPDQIASPIREQLLKRVARRLGLPSEEAESCIDALNVQVKPLSSIIEKYALERVDVLQVDCEGWDVKVLRSLGTHRPAIIHFESKNLTSEDWRDFVLWSKEADYGFIQMPQDTLAIRGFSGRHEL